MHLSPSMPATHTGLYSTKAQGLPEYDHSSQAFDTRQIRSTSMPADVMPISEPFHRPARQRMAVLPTYAPNTASQIHARPEPLVRRNKSAKTRRNHEKTYVHCPFRVHSALYSPTSWLRKSECVMHFSEARYLRNHMISCLETSLAPCRSCGSKIFWTLSPHGLHTDFRICCCSNTPLNPLEIRHAVIKIPARLQGGVVRAFEIIWTLIFPRQPLPRADDWTCPGRKRCIGFEQRVSNSSEQLSHNRTAPTLDATAASRDASLSTSSYHLLSPESLPNVTSEDTSGRDRSPEEHATIMALLNDDDVLDKLCEHLDELRARIGDSKLRDVLSELLSPPPEEPRIGTGDFQSTAEPSSERSVHKTVTSNVDSAQRSSNGLIPMKTSRTLCQVSDKGVTYTYSRSVGPHHRSSRGSAFKVYPKSVTETPYGLCSVTFENL
jgi:hypothetical protein